MAAQESRWLCFLLAELGAPQPCPTLWCDNASTIHLTQDPVYHARSKHIELRYFFIRELHRPRSHRSSPRCRRNRCHHSSWPLWTLRVLSLGELVSWGATTKGARSRAAGFGGADAESARFGGVSAEGTGIGGAAGMGHPAPQQSK
ncbi:unnamed protein product [Closterium sp. NIES-54]